MITPRLEVKQELIRDFLPGLLISSLNSQQGGHELVEAVFAAEEARPAVYAQILPTFPKFPYKYMKKNNKQLPGFVYITFNPNFVRKSFEYVTCSLQVPWTESL